MIISCCMFFLIIFQCWPVGFFWGQFKGDSGTCLSADIVKNSVIGYSVINACADWTLGILPIFLVWNLTINLRTKISVAVILALGAVYVSWSNNCAVGADG
jgi:hypothetical protein